MKWGVLSGGNTAEREVSLASGDFVCEQLKALGEDFAAIVLEDDPVTPILEADVDAFVIALHGGWGEDGRIQSFLDLLGKPYTGSRPLSSALAMNKSAAKLVFTASGVPTPRWRRIRKPAEIEIALAELPAHLVIKPTAEGSSVGVQLAHRKGAKRTAEVALQLFDDILIEEFIDGKFLTVTVFDTARETRTLPPLEIVPLEGRLYDRRAKTQGLRRYNAEPELPATMAEHVKEVALSAHRALGCRGITRTDCIVTGDTNQIYVLEVNTIPGMGPTGNLVTTCAAAGIAGPSLARVLLDSV